MDTIMGLIMTALCLWSAIGTWGWCRWLSVLGWFEVAFFFFTTFGSGIISFIEEVCTGEDDSDPSIRDGDPSLRSSGMTHGEFEQWLRDTCENAPNHTAKYNGCDGTKYRIQYNFLFERGGWKYGQDDGARIYLFEPPLENPEDSLLAKQKRSKEELRENFFAEFKKRLTDNVSSVNSSFFKCMGQQYCEDRILSDKHKKEFCDDAMYFGREVVEDYEYISSEFDKLCDRLFGANAEGKKSNADTRPAEIAKKCEAPAVKNAVQPLVKAAVKAKAVAPYQAKMDRLLKQYKDYDTELRNLGTETTNYKKCLDAIQSELNRQCEYVARIAEIERKQSDISDNPKAAEISKKVRDSYKTKRKEAENNIASLIDRAEQVIVLMQQDLENHVYDAKAQVETGKIDDMLSKLENSVQLDQEINGKAAKICLELKGIEPDSKG